MTAPPLFTLADPNFCLLLAILVAGVVAPLVYAAWGLRKIQKERKP